jgi:simple sugar transport system permease protein
MSFSYFFKLAGVNLGAVAVGLSLGMLIVYITGADIILAASTLILAPVSDLYNVAEMFVWFTALVVIAQGIGLGIRAGVWNVGAPGQFLVGSILTMMVWKFLNPFIPPLPLTLLMLVGGAAGGLLWALIPAVIRSKFGGNEIVVTLLLNLVAVSVLWWALDGPIRGRFSAGYPLSDVIPTAYRIPSLIPDSRLSYSLLIALAVAAVFYLLAEKTHFGLQVKSVGLNPTAAKTSGIKVGWTLFKTLLIAGAAAGFAGSLHLMGVLFRMDAGYAETGNDFGYIAIAVAMLGGAHPVGILFSSIFFSYMMIGAQNMQRIIQIPFPLVYAVVGCMLISLTLVQRIYRRAV